MINEGQTGENFTNHTENKHESIIAKNIRLLNLILSKKFPDTNGAHFKREYQQADLDNDLMEAIEYITQNSDPNEVAELLLTTPQQITYKDMGTQEITTIEPKIDIIPPSLDEIKYVGKKLEVLDPIYVNGKDLVKDLESHLDAYLLSPKIDDHLEGPDTYTKRKHWEYAILGTLSLLDARAGTGEAFQNAFSEKWGQTKYATNPISIAINYADTILHHLQKDTKASLPLKEFVENSIKTLKETKDKNLRVHQLTSNCIKLINSLSQKSG